MLLVLFVVFVAVDAWLIWQWTTLFALVGPDYIDMLAPSLVMPNLFGTTSLLIDAAILTASLLSIAFYLRHDSAWRVLALMTLAMTSVSSAWYLIPPLSGDTTVYWKAGMALLAIYPLFFVRAVGRGALAD